MRFFIGALVVVAAAIGGLIAGLPEPVHASEARAMPMTRIFLVDDT